MFVLGAPMLLGAARGLNLHILRDIVAFAELVQIFDLPGSGSAPLFLRAGLGSCLPASLQAALGLSHGVHLR